MALDGIVISNIAEELSQTLTGGRIIKISQPAINPRLVAKFVGKNRADSDKSLVEGFCSGKRL